MFSDKASRCAIVAPLNRGRALACNGVSGAGRRERIVDLRGERRAGGPALRTAKKHLVGEDSGDADVNRASIIPRPIAAKERP
jgi:hypothetical protein